MWFGRRTQEPDRLKVDRHGVRQKREALEYGGSVDADVETMRMYRIW